MLTVAQEVLDSKDNPKQSGLKVHSGTLGKKKTVALMSRFMHVHVLTGVCLCAHNNNNLQNHHKFVSDHLRNSFKL